VHCQPGDELEVDDAPAAASGWQDAWRTRLRRARPWVERVHGWLLPPRCVLCLDPGRGPTLDLCAACEADLPVVGTACPCCGEALVEAATPPRACARCLVDPPPYSRVIAPFRYAWPVDALVRGFKYHGQLAHGRVLGTLLAEAVLAAGAAVPPLLVPVPLHPARERERGYNQSWELARVAARLLDVAVAPTLCVRTRATPPQATLDAAARRTNLAGAFAVRRPPGTSHVALVDDVLTTGATLAALAAALLTAGVRRVDCWTVARASGPSPG
jgi:ComF family protein